MAYTTSSFKTRARTIDHLGREQIADCPTAISELWKNSYDAYATEVSLHLFDGDVDVAALLDNGHGMCRDEFETKWLTVGTESKTDNSVTPTEDRNRLDVRPKHGQKGIGRLSSASLGPLLLLISKRANSKYVVSLVDWRLFENPYLYLDDIRIPITELNHCRELIDELPLMFDTLMGNVWGDSDDKERNIRLLNAWEEFSLLEVEKGTSKNLTTKVKIESSLIKDIFTDRHFDKCKLWESELETGTAMFIADLQDDLKAQLSSIDSTAAEESIKSYRDNFFQTLSNFTDPYSFHDEKRNNRFDYSVTAWRGLVPEVILDNRKQFDLKNLQELEHIIEGEVDSEGYFSGRVKVFGEWIDDYIIKPAQVYKTRRDSAFGPFSLRFGTFEMQIGSTSLTDEQHAFFSEQAERYGGLRVYRDELRVMPYGRTDNDYFDIEYRRSKHAGRYFWANRRMFGRVAITGRNNPNLKDKAGREGFIENRASKLFKEIVEKILIDSAREHFGTVSEQRKPMLELIQEQKAELKAEADKNKLLTREKKRIRSAIKHNTKPLIQKINALNELKHSLENRIEINSIDEIHQFKIEVDKQTESMKAFSLSPVPPNLGRLEDDYRYYRKFEIEAKDIIQQLTQAINAYLVDSKQKTDYEKAMEVYRSKVASINSSINKNATRGREVLSQQKVEIENLIKYCREQYKTSVETILEDLKLEKVSLVRVLQVLDEEQAKVEVENSQKLMPYITALESTNEQIDLEGLAIHSMNESVRVREELIRLHSLAQLGIAVEIIGHELESLDLTVDFAFKSLFSSSMNSEQSKDLKRASDAHVALMDKLNFLSPLKLSGEKVVNKISGNDIYQYVLTYFKEQFEKNNIKLVATDEFKKICILDLASRIFPVFINLVNNSFYWVQNFEESQREIVFDFIGGQVVVADDGPGVEQDDISQLFTLFFTRRQRGGRGVGLYLSKQNLQASGHRIRYETRDNYKALSGANFAIEFKGVTHV